MSDSCSSGDDGSTVRSVPKIRIVLVEPMYKGNIGSAARVMKNFGLTDLALVNPCALGPEAWAMASHARDVLENACICSTVDEAVAGCDVVVGTTGARAFKKCDHVRTPALLPGEIRAQLEIFGSETTTAVLFGREDHGFKNEELELCTMIATIPTSSVYPVMNLSHAVGVMAYELTGARQAGSYKTAGRADFENLCDHFRELLEDADYSPQKKDPAVLMFRRIFGRAYLTPCEVSTLRGIFRNLQYPIRKGKGADVSKRKSSVTNVFEKTGYGSPGPEGGTGSEPESEQKSGPGSEWISEPALDMISREISRKNRGEG